MLSPQVKDFFKGQGLPYLSACLPNTALSEVQRLLHYIPHRPRRQWRWTDAPRPCSALVGERWTSPVLLVSSFLFLERQFTRAADPSLVRVGERKREGTLDLSPFEVMTK